MSNEERIAELKQKRELINKVSPSFCTAKWLQTTLYLQNGYNHSCHHPPPHKIPVEEILKNPAALHNSEHKKEQRDLMLKGERPSECDYCWKIEDLGKDYFSDRHYKTADPWAWDRFEEIANSKSADDVYPSYLEISFSNACNLACAYCSPEISSKWMEEITKFGSYPVSMGNHDLGYLKSIEKYPYKHSEQNPYVDAFWEWFPAALPYLKVLRVTGGEPTMSKDVWKLFDYIIQNPPTNKIEIAINTNACVENGILSKLITKVNELNELGITVTIYTSIESIGEQAEYARYGMNYEKWKNNVNRLLSETKSVVIIMTTINILSLPTFAHFIETVMEFRIKYNLDFSYNRIPMSINYLRWPPHLSFTLLDLESRIEIANQIESYCKHWLKYESKEKFARIYLEEYDQIQRLCDYMRTANTATEYRSDFVKYINEYDKRRNLNFVEIFAEYEHLLEEWK